jgi:protein SCO1/2
MSEMIDRIKAACGDVLIPAMITCDPARDQPAVLKQYLKEFHPDIIGLTGEYENIKQTCKVYRVYFSTPPHVKPGQDYLVDHSIYFYLMGKSAVNSVLGKVWLTKLILDPEGDFVEVIGRNVNAAEGSKVIIDHIRDWDGFLDESPRRKEPVELTKATKGPVPATV